jgi:hypothetical protein
VPAQNPQPGKKWKLGISRKLIDNKWKWTVDSPSGKIHRGLDPDNADPGRDPDTIEWTLHPDPNDKDKAISAHFQFAHGDLLTGYTGVDDLTRDLTAVIAKSGGTLELKLKKSACRRKNPRYYAVWIQDDDLEHGGEFAVGEAGNPPPEMQVGP